VSDLAELETFYDTMPRHHADVEEVGPFTLFVKRPDGWPFYARPRLGGDGPFDADAVRRVLDRMRELDVPLAIEWVHDVTPGLLSAVQAEGTLEPGAHPLMVLADDPEAPQVADDVTLRMLGADDEDLLGSVRAVQDLAFGPAQDPPAGVAERDAAAEEPSDLRRSQLRSGESRIAVAEHPERGILAAGQHLSAAGVSEIVGVATLPSEQGARLGSAITWALVADARSRGVGTVFLSAGSERIARIYGRLGFRTVGVAYVAEPPNA
jgi:GNAT superfamily N-acetyltransferase